MGQAIRKENHVERVPGIVLKEYPKSIYDLIIDKQSEQKKKHRPINLSQAVVMLLKEAYIKDPIDTSRQKA